MPSTISFKKVLPQMHYNGVAFHIKGVFVADDLYYVGVFSNKFY
jgi:hypothetical protein